MQDKPNDSTEPQTAYVPEGKTDRATLEKHGWVYLRSTGGGHTFKHGATGDLLKLSAQGYATKL